MNNKTTKALTLAALMSLPVMAAQEDVYRWVDENGVVHYADQPRSAEAKRFVLRNNNYSTPSVTPEELAIHNKVLAKFSESTSQTANELSDEASALSESDEEQPQNTLGSYPQKSCDYLREQISRADAYVNSADVERAEQAKRQVQIAEKMMRDGQCN